jgi:hypothetical protein
MAYELTNGQKTFVNEFAAETGLDRHVVAAWVYNEENGSAARSREASNNHDWLNIGYTDSATLGAGNSFWNDPKSAAHASAQWIKGQFDVPGFGRASSGIRGILRTVGMSPAAQISAIQNSGWASSHYPSLPSIYAGIVGSGGGGLGSAITNPIKGAVGAGESAASAVGGAVSGAASALNPENIVKGIAGAIDRGVMIFVYSLAIIGGGALLLLGLLMVGAELGIDQAKEPRPVRLARTAVTKGKLAKASSAAGQAKGERKGYKEGFGQGEMYAADKESRAAERQNIKEFNKSKRLPLTELKTGKSGGQKGPGDLPEGY